MESRPRAPGRIDSCSASAQRRWPASVSSARATRGRERRRQREQQGVERRQEHVGAGRSNDRGRLSAKLSPPRHVVLHLDVDGDALAPSPVEHLAEPRDRRALAEVEGHELLLGHLADAARIAAACHARERVVVEDDDPAAGARSHVELDRAGSLRARLTRTPRACSRAAIPPLARRDDRRRGATPPRRSRSPLRALRRSSAPAPAPPPTLSAGSEMAPTTGCPPPPYRSQMAAMLWRRGTGRPGVVADADLALALRAAEHHRVRALRVEGVRHELAGDLDELLGADRHRPPTPIGCAALLDELHELLVRPTERLVRLRHVLRARDVGERLLEEARAPSRRGTRRRPGARRPS